MSGPHETRPGIASRYAAAGALLAGLLGGCHGRPAGPAASSPHPGGPQRASVRITVTADGGYLLDGTPVTLDELAARLEAIAAAAPHDGDDLPTTRVVIRASHDCDYSHVQAAMVACMKAYIWRLEFEGLPDADVERPSAGDAVDRTPRPRPEG